MDAFRSSTSRRFYSSMSLALRFVPALKTAVTNTYHKTNQGKMINEISLKNTDKRTFLTVNDCSTFFSAEISQAKNGEPLVVVFFRRLKCTHNPCLSKCPHMCVSHRMKILPVVVSIVFCYQKYIFCNKVQALS